MVVSAARDTSLLRAAAGGLLFALATPPIDLLLGVPLGLLLLAHAIRSAKSVRRGALLGIVWATTAGLLGMRFIPSVITRFTDLGQVAATSAHLLLSAAQSLWWGLGMGLCVGLHRRLGAAFEIAFALTVLLTLCMPNVFVWSPAGLLSPWPLLVQSADLIGERGVSAVLAFHMALASTINGNVLRDLRTNRGARRRVLGVMLLPIPFVLYGLSTMTRYASEDGPQARIALVQAATHPQYRWQTKNWPRILDTLRQQTRIAEAAGVDLTVWPEAAYPYPLTHDATRAPRDRRRRLIDDQLRGPLLFGLISMAPPIREPDGRFRRDRYNSATLVSADGTLQPSYDKMELLWFGETVPGGTYLPWLKRMFQRSGGLIPGAELRALRTTLAGGVELRIGVLNCYEDTLPDLGRRIVQELDPNLLVNVTNDAWFIGTAEPELHLRLSVMRAIELRRDLVRSVNLGVSAWVDARGRIRAQQATSEPGALIVTPRLRSTPATLYARFGDLPLLLLLAAAACVPWVRRTFGGNDNADEAESVEERSV